MEQTVIQCLDSVVLLQIRRYVFTFFTFHALTVFLLVLQICKSICTLYFSI
jgi:hypothetical protein